MAHDEPSGAALRLRREIDPSRDHMRGRPGEDTVSVVAYLDFLCPYCRRLRPVFMRLRETLGDRLVYVYRYLPIERANPGAELVAHAAEAAARQGKFFEMYDRLFDREPPFGRTELVEIARDIGLDVPRFLRDLDSAEVARRVADDVSDARSNGVTGTPTLFIDGVRYDGAWDYYSMLDAIERPFAERVGRSARVFASLPTAAGLVLLVAAVLALVIANSPLAPLYRSAIDAEIRVGTEAHGFFLTTRDWLAEGLLSFFFLIVGLELRREITTGALVNRRAAILPAIGAFGGVIMPAVIYLAINPGATRGGWPIPTATDVAFTLAILAVLGDRVPIGLRAFVAALAVVDDIITIGTIAIVFPSSFAPIYTIAVAITIAGLVALNRARVYAPWPYVLVAIALWMSLHLLGVDGALTGVILAFCLPGRPTPSPAPLVAQAATALAALDHVDKEARRAGREAKLESEPVWDWALRNLSATTERLLSPAERIERAVAPWSAFLVLPLFAFAAAGVSLSIDLSSPDSRRVFAGVIAGLVIGKPLGIVLATLLTAATGLAALPEGVTRRQLIGAACTCGVGDTLALLLADRAFTAEAAAVAKLGVLLGSVLAGVLGYIVLRHRAPTTQTAEPMPSPTRAELSVAH